MGNLGWSEILIILVIALIVFGPRKLPELGKSLGQSLAQFRRASEDFKRTWEQEVEIEKSRLEAPPPAVEREYETAPAETSDAQDASASAAQPEDTDSTAPEQTAIEETAPAQQHTVAVETKRDWM